MTSLLHLDSGANRSDESVSRRLTALFARTWRTAHGPAGYRYRDLAADPVPPLGTAYCSLGRRAERTGLVPPDGVDALTRSEAEKREWSLTRPLITELLAADTLLVGAPLYNFSVSAALKAWIDRVGFPGALTDPDTGEGLLRGTKVVVISPRGGAYGPGTPREGWDFQTPYLRAYFGEKGVAPEDLCFVNAEMTMAELVPGLARFRPLAASSLAAARTEVTVAASGGESADGRSAGAGGRIEATAG
ncbi:FMN-dependent NADH-azoreductase [Streptomyces sp. NPDC059818]|uniref:FMN-dependent NADH-azoreductase n=1 Tax=Streptomyces sp. NPDC059818 TaxID=3346962 RepID=UPI00365EE30D